MPILKYTIALLFSLLPFLQMKAQFVNNGADPARYKWNYVDLPHYKLIFPQGTDSMAYKYALYLENIYPHIQKTISMPRKRMFPVVLHPGNMLSNGMVAWAPRRMELNTTPSSRIHAQSWDKHLVLHESRHVVQTSKLMTGLFNPLYYIIGDQAAGVSSFFSTSWFFEGDAVGVETAMSNSGRGRLPEFNMVYRAQMASGNFYSFDKWYLGSYKDYTGDYYALGYDMTSYAKYRYGADIWDKITSRYVSRFLLIPPFTNAMKYHTDDNVDGLFEKTFNYLKEEWESLAPDNEAPEYLSTEAKDYTSYRYPLAINDSIVVAVKSNLSDINSLVMLTPGKEERLAYLGSVNSRLSRHNNRIYWSENVSGLRWTHENYSEVKFYDLHTGHIEKLTSRQRYLSPAVNRTGDRIAVSRFSPSGENEVILLDARDGSELSQYSTPLNAFVKELTFGEDDQVYTIAVSDAGMHIFQLRTLTGEWTELLPATVANITSPVWNDHKLYFESGLNGTNNIYYLDLNGSGVYKVTSAQFGAFDPSLTDDHRLVFSDYQAKGYRVGSISLEDKEAQKVDMNRPYRFRLAETLAQQEQFNLDTAKLTPITFNPKPYRKALNTFKIHSWAPFYYDVAEIMGGGSDDFSTIVRPGATILSQNALNTAITQAGWYYDDGNHHLKMAFTYLGWYPVIDLLVDYGDRAIDMSWEKNDQGNEVGVSRYAGRSLVEAEARVYIPFNLTTNHYIRGIQPILTYYFTNNRYQQYESRNFSNFQYLLSELRFYNYRRMARRDILPRWGYQVRLQYLNTPFNSENYGSLYAGRITTYWPGLMRNHSLMLRAGYQYQSIDNKVLYLPKRIMDKTRGYDYLYQTRQQIALKADYAFTLLTPDISFGSLIYISRIRTNLFYDHTLNQRLKHASWTTQSSAGLDLIFDWNVIRMSYPLSMGARFIQPIDYGKFQVEMLFSISF